MVNARVKFVIWYPLWGPSTDKHVFPGPLIHTISKPKVHHTYYPNNSFFSQTIRTMWTVQCGPVQAFNLDQFKRNIHKLLSHPLPIFSAINPPRIDNSLFWEKEPISWLSAHRGERRIGGGWGGGLKCTPVGLQAKNVFSNCQKQNVQKIRIAFWSKSFCDKILSIQQGFHTVRIT